MDLKGPSVCPFAFQRNSKILVLAATVYIEAQYHGNIEQSDGEQQTAIITRSRIKVYIFVVFVFY